MSRSISFWPSTMATRSSSAWVALNSMRFMMSSRRDDAHGKREEEAAAGGSRRAGLACYAATGVTEDGRAGSMGCRPTGAGCEMRMVLVRIGPVKARK